MNIFKKYFILCCSLFFFTSNSYAFIYAAADAKIGFGSNQSSDGTSIKSRSLLNYSAEGSAGLTYLGFIAGVSGEYSLLKQVTKPSKVGNSNTQGTLTAVYPMIGYSFLTFRVIAKLPSALMSEYVLNKVNSAGATVTYKDASVMGVQLHMITSPINFWGVEYQSLTFKKVNQGGSDITLSSDSKFKMSSYSLMYGFFF